MRLLTHCVSLSVIERTDKIKMKKALLFILTLIMLLTLASPALADFGRTFTANITSDSKTFTENDEEVNAIISGYLNTKLYSLASPSGNGILDRSAFESMTVDILYIGDIYTAVREELVARNGFSYVSDNPEVVFIDNEKGMRAISEGSANITVKSGAGRTLAKFTATVTEENGEYVIAADCPKCGKNQGAAFHMMHCGHFICKDGAEGHEIAECGLLGHSKCDAKDHGICTNCMGRLCVGIHGTGICEHEHRWELRMGTTNDENTPDGYRYDPFPYYYCPICDGFRSVIADRSPYEYLPSD